MRKLIAVMNMTLDGFCDHTAAVPSDEGMRFFNDLLRNSGALLYGRTTYQMMESYWPLLVKSPSSDKLDNEFAILIDNIQKIVYSRTLLRVDWKNSTLKKEVVPEEILDLKRGAGKDLVAGSPSVIVALTKMGLVDEFQLVVHPVILGKGLPLFKDIQDRIDLKLLKTKTLDSGAVIFYYEPLRK